MSEYTDIRIVTTVLPVSTEQVCRHGDPHCPCPDGDVCHYVTRGGSAAIPCPRTGTVDCVGCTLNDGHGDTRC